jgi:ribonuclease BN (tRNA processing enzyme)
MRLTFIGTCGYIDPRNERHRMHTALLVTHRRRRVMIDCGEDWLGRIGEVKPHAIVLTHGHPDHAWGLAQGAPCPVYATADTWNVIAGYPIEEQIEFEPRKPFDVEGLTFEAFTVQHSLTSPAVGFRVSDGKMTFFYSPDLVYIDEREDALRGVDLYIGDGATVTVSFVRKQKGALIGHTPVRTQLTWCKKSGVPRALITHCGKEIVGGDEQAMLAMVKAAGAERGVEVDFASDGMQVDLK